MKKLFFLLFFSLCVAYMYAIVRKYVHGTQAVVATRTGQTDWIGWNSVLDFGTIKVTEF